MLEQILCEKFEMTPIVDGEKYSFPYEDEEGNAILPVIEVLHSEKYGKRYIGTIFINNKSKFQRLDYDLESLVIPMLCVLDTIAA